MTRALDIVRLWNGEPAEPGEHVRLELTETDDELTVRVDAPSHGDPPPGTPPGRCDGLWEHEVVELFLVGEDDRYLELEFGPAGHWLGLRLHGVRRVVEPDVRVAYAVESTGSRWRARARVARDRAPAPILRWNAFAIHGTGKRRRFLAASPLPGERPDFHRIDRFPAY